MKKQSRLIVFMVGVMIGATITLIFNLKFRTAASLQAGEPAGTQKKDNTQWIWADSLDAVKAAPKNHHVLFENDKIRILEVILNPYEYESMHVHRYPSVMFGATKEKTPPFDIVYYRYGYDSIHHAYYMRDSNQQHSDASKPDDPDSGNYMMPEGPHRIKNLSNVKIDVFRVELKPPVKN